MVPQIFHKRNETIQSTKYFTKPNLCKQQILHKLYKRWIFGGDWRKTAWKYLVPEWRQYKKLGWIRKNRKIYSNHFGIQVSLILHKCDICYKWFVQEWMSTLFLGKPAGFMWSSTDSFFISLELCCNFAISFWNWNMKISCNTFYLIDFHAHLQVSLGQHHILIINQRKLCHHSSSQYVKA